MRGISQKELAGAYGCDPEYNLTGGKESHLSIASSSFSYCRESFCGGCHVIQGTWGCRKMSMCIL